MISPTEQQWGFILGEAIEAKKDAIIEILSNPQNRGNIEGLVSGLATRMNPTEVESLVRELSVDADFLQSIGIDVPPSETDAPLPYVFSDQQINILISGSLDNVRDILLSVEQEFGIDSLGAGLVSALGSYKLGTLLERTVSDTALWAGLEMPVPTPTDIRSMTANYTPSSAIVEVITNGEIGEKRSALLEMFSETSGPPEFTTALAVFLNENELSRLAIDFSDDRSFWAELGMSPPSSGEQSIDDSHSEAPSLEEELLQTVGVNGIDSDGFGVAVV